MKKIVLLSNAHIAVKKFQALSLQSYIAFSIPIFIFLGLVLYGPETFALNDQDRLAELTTLTTEVGKLTKTGCYIAGGVSSLVGLIWSIAAQNLKILAASAVITVFAFKAPALFTSTMLI